MKTNIDKDLQVYHEDSESQAPTESTGTLGLVLVIVVDVDLTVAAVHTVLVPAWVLILAVLTHVVITTAAE